MEKENPIIIAIIPTHGAGDAFIECITSLTQQTLKPTQLLVIDNNVKDGSIDKLVQQNNTSRESATINGIPLKIIKLKTNTGVTGGRNAGIDALPIEYDYALFVDHDMIAESHMLEELYKTMQKDQKIGLVTPKIYYWENKNIIWSAGTDINPKTGQTIFYGGEDNGQYNQEKEVAVAPAIFLVKKQVLNAINHFDEIYFATYEDTDFCFAAKRKGFTTWYSPTSIAYHKIPYDPETAMNRLLERSYYVGRNRYVFLRKFNLFSGISIAYIPIYALYYSYLGLKYNNIQSILNYYKGVFAGLTTKITAP
jgi:GT2 family glycosyltransferase